MFIIFSEYKPEIVNMLTVMGYIDILMKGLAKKSYYNPII